MLLKIQWIYKFTEFTKISVNSTKDNSLADVGSQQ